MRIRNHFLWLISTTTSPYRFNVSFYRWRLDVVTATITVLGYGVGLVYLGPKTRSAALVEDYREAAAILNE